MPAKRIKVLTISFDTQIKGHEISAFRGEVIQKLGQEHELFNSHNNANTPNSGGFHYRYPLIQYKSTAGHPTIQCIEESLHEIEQVFTQTHWDMEISGNTHSMKALNIQLNEFDLQVTDDQYQTYNISNWIALNSDKFKRYNLLETEVERIQMLQSILTANILAFGRGVDWRIDQPVKVLITNAPKQHSVTLKKQRMVAFHLQFKTNVTLPNLIGLGKSVALGFGSIQLTDS